MPAHSQIQPLQIPRSICIAALLILGVWLCETRQWSFAAAALLTVGTAGLSLMAIRHSRGRYPAIAAAGLSLVFLGASLWAFRQSVSARQGNDIGQLIAAGKLIPGVAIRVSGTILNLPATDLPHVRRGGDGMSRAESGSVRTLFLLNASSVTIDDRPMPVHGLCRVLVDGDGTARLKMGDRVQFTGHLDVPLPPMNPGEFDYLRHLRHRGISSLAFVRHLSAIEVTQRSPWHPGSLLTTARQMITESFARSLSPHNRATAEALLLGNRGHLAADLERDFISSGTMHLLAISGLHAGILYLFLLRMLNLLLVSRTRALILAGLVCAVYCLLTDMRASVLRATVFIALHILAQLTKREVRMVSLVGAAATLLVITNPGIVFDTGAWLSFLAVSAVSWISDRTPPPEDRPVPADLPSWRERWAIFRDAAWHWLSVRYRQMFLVTLLAAPLVATQFHVVSLTGMVINIVMIPFTMVTLISGYIFTAVSIIIPPLSGIPGTVFGGLLTMLNLTVRLAADVRFGFITIPDLPFWFLPAYYGLLAASVLTTRQTPRKVLRLGMLVLVVVQTGDFCRTKDHQDLVCTVLSVGHGNAVVVEAGNRVLLFDAGALNRGERTADTISRFLWSRGHRRIDAIVISHADADHYNAVCSLMDRVPVDQVMIPVEFAESGSADVQRVMSRLMASRCSCQIVMHGDSIRLPGAHVDFLQARDLPGTKATDNEYSLVALLSGGGQRICLPGDLEGRGQQALLPHLPNCQVLVSPHHGSSNSNSMDLADQVQPDYVIVSCRNEKMRRALNDIYRNSHVLMTCTDGAVSVRIERGGRLAVSAYNMNIRQPDTRPGTDGQQSERRDLHTRDLAGGARTRQQGRFTDESSL